MPKINARHALAIALQRAGFRRDPRASEAYSLPGQEGMVRVDFGGPRSKSASIQAKHSAGASYSNIGETLYFGYMKSEADVDGWARYLHAIATGGTEVPHPPIPKRKEPRPETVARREREKERTVGRGFYVVNKTTGGVMTSGRLAANHGPFATLDEAVPVAWQQLQEYLTMRFTYLLPVKIVQAKNKTEAERGGGYVWWIDGRMKGEPVPEEQTRFANMASSKAPAHPMTSRDIALALSHVLSPLLYGRMFRVSNGEEPPLAGVSDHVTVTWSNVDAEAPEIDALNAQKSIMLAIDAPEWGQNRVDRARIGQIPVSKVKVRKFRGRSDFRARAGTPEQIVAYVARWFYKNAFASTESMRLTRERAERMGFDIAKGTST